MATGFAAGPHGLAVVAETGDRFADFAPYVAAIDDDRTVTCSAMLTEGGSGVFSSDGGRITTVADSTSASFHEIRSHPASIGTGSPVAARFGRRPRIATPPAPWTDAAGNVRCEAYTCPTTDKETGMSFFCRVGLHRWSFSTQLLDEPGHRTHTEIVRARCTRDACARYGAWSLVHREAALPGPTSRDTPARLA